MIHKYQTDIINFLYIVEQSKFIKIFDKVSLVNTKLKKSLLSYHLNQLIKHNIIIKNKQNKGYPIYTLNDKIRLVKQEENFRYY